MRTLPRIAAIGLLLALAIPAAAAQKKDSEPKYDSATEVTLKGTVQELKQVEAAKGDIHLIVKTDSGVFEVCLCPQKFLDEVELGFKSGDAVTVVGSKVKMEEREVVLAREITSGNNTLTLRDKKGNPVWTYLVQPQ